MDYRARNGIGVIILLLGHIQLIFGISHDNMKCTYGERGSLTATCVNAIPSYFKYTNYRFDQLDDTVRCLLCNLKIIEANTFDLSGNQIRILDLPYSQIELLKPKAFMGLVYLERLNMSSNRIQVISAGTFNGTKKILDLDLDFNNISRLVDDGFKELINLNTLRLAHNQIENISKNAFCGLNSLDSLDLKDNHISTLDNSTFRNVTNLVDLDLSHNLLQTLNGEEFTCLGKLRDLDLSYNKLKLIKFKMNPGNLLGTLNLRNNLIERLWFPMERLDALAMLLLGNNQIVEMSQLRAAVHLRNLAYLDLSSNNLTILFTDELAMFPELNSLVVFNNQITSFQIVGYKSMQNVVWLDLSNNRIQNIDFLPFIRRLPSLGYLAMQGNPLPCTIIQEMESVVLDENFKLVLSNDSFPHHCVNYENDVQSKRKQVDDDDFSVANVFIFVIMTIVVIALCLLIYLNYIVFKEKGLGRIITRAISTDNLVTNDNHEDDQIIHL